MRIVARRVGAAVLVVVAALAAAASWGPLRNLFADYQDSPWWVYVAFGVPCLLAAAVALVAARRLLRRRPPVA